MQLLIGLFGGLLAHSTYRRAATFSSSFTESRLAFGVWRSIVLVLEIVGIADAMCDAPSTWRGAALPR
jgi:hypothetical protein